MTYPSKQLYLYPLWLRLWHWGNAVLFLLLLISGVSLHFTDSQGALLPFRTALMLHNSCGLLLAVLYGLFVVVNWRSGNVRHYRPRYEHWRQWLAALQRQALFYGVGIFRGEPHPFPATAEQKFNPLQQLTYLLVVYLGLPLLIISGIWYLFPDQAPDQVLGWGGVWPVALFHYLVALFLTLFLLGHLYLATAGPTLTGELRKMITGWADEEEQH
ncbi:MAG: cytochrome b/b6 domain-containing protein [Magnetococcales bacterium]|nr:cytochrome b/b6 domain-containing protein [Magnetococcales bacterium]